MRVFQDEYVDCALLAFDKVVVNPTLRIAVRSLILHRGAFLGPNGVVQDQPYFFTTERIVTDFGPCFRAGPELCIHMREFDHVEVSSDDDWLVEQGVWGPRVSASENERGYYTIGTDEPSEDAATGNNAEFDRALADTIASPMADLGQQDRRIKAYQEPNQHDHQSKTKRPPSAALAPKASSGANTWWLATGFLVLALATFGYIAAPEIRCSVLGACNAASLVNDDERLERAGANVARNCAAAKRLASDFCSVEEVCIAPYLSQFPHGPSRLKLERLAADAATECTAAKRMAQQADPPNQEQATVVLASAAHETPALPQPPLTTDSIPATANDADTKDAEQLFAAAQQCTSANPCIAPACYAEVRKRFPSGPRANDIETELVSAYQSCSSLPNTELLDGVYDGRVRSSCSAPQFGIQITVNDGKLAWQHDVALKNSDAPVAVQWEGHIDHHGNIRATARDGEYSASGKYHGAEREVYMKYSECVATLTIAARLK